MTTDRADLRQIGLTVLNWTPCWSHLLSAIQVHIPTLQVLQRTIGSLSSPKAGPDNRDCTNVDIAY